MGYDPEFWTNRQSLTPPTNTRGAAVVGDVAIASVGCDVTETQNATHPVMAF